MLLIFPPSNRVLKEETSSLSSTLLSPGPGNLAGTLHSVYAAQYILWSDRVNEKVLKQVLDVRGSNRNDSP